MDHPLVTGKMAHIKGIIQLDENLHVTTINTNGEMLFETTAEKIIGKYLPNFLKNSPEFNRLLVSLQTIHDNSTDDPMPIITPINRQKIAKVIWFIYTIKDNNKKLSSYLLVGDDATEEEKSLTQKINIESYLDNILLHFPGYLYWKDVNSVYLGCNMSFAKVAGLSSPEQIIGKTDYDLVWGKTQADLFRKGDENVIAGNSLMNIEEPQLQADGKIAIVLASKVPLRDKNKKITGLLGIYSDITDRKEMEKKLREVNSKLEAVNHKLTASDLKTKFIQNMQHDIRTPLSGIFQYMEMLSESETDPEKKYYATLMRASTGQLLNMCNEIVDFESINYLGDTSTLEVIDTLKFLNSVIDLNKMAALGRGLEINITIDSQVPNRLKLDKRKLYRVLVNLIGNSLKFTEAGSVSLHVKLLSKDQTTNTLSFQIIDTGVGIPADKIDLIFDKFVRLNPSNQSKYKGSGLGLYYVKKFVHDMQGQLDVKSELGKGSVFSIILNLPIPKESELPQDTPNEIITYVDTHIPEYQKPAVTIQPVANSAIEKSLENNGDKPTVLLIEDDPILQKMIANTLTKTNFHVVAMTNTVQAACDAIKNMRYDLVICDLGLLDGTGFDVIKWVKKDKAHPNQTTPFIVLTANNDEDMRVESKTSGFLDVFQKPLTDCIARQIYQHYISDKYVEKASSVEENTIIDIPSSIAVSGNLSLVKETFQMLTTTLLKDKLDLQLYFEKNDIEATRQILHRLDGSLRYCIAPKLQASRTALHDAIRATSDLHQQVSLYNEFYSEIDCYLATFEHFKETAIL